MNISLNREDFLLNNPLIYGTFLVLKSTLVPTPTTETKTAGTQTFRSSDWITIQPLSVKKFRGPIGETLIGLYSKKNLSELQGIKNPTPKPPVVIASKAP